MHIRVATNPQPTATQAAPGVSRQVSAVAIDTMRVAMPGIQVAPTRVIATISLVTDSGKGDSLSGSMVGSMPGGEQRDEEPAEGDGHPADHHGRLLDLLRVDDQHRKPGDRDHQDDHGLQRPEDHREQLQHVAVQRVGEHAEPQAQERRNHSGPSLNRRPPTSSRKRSSRVPDPRTSSIVPATSTLPRATIAT